MQNLVPEARQKRREVVMTALDAQKEIEQMRRDAYREQEVELRNNFKRLSLENRARVAMFSRELLEEEKSAALNRKLLEAFRQLNEEGQRLVVAYVKALAANPKYRRSSSTAKCGQKENHQ